MGMGKYACFMKMYVYIYYWKVCQCADLTMTCPKLHVIIIKWACL